MRHFLKDKGKTDSSWSGLFLQWCAGGRGTHPANAGASFWSLQDQTLYCHDWPSFSPELPPSLESQWGGEGDKRKREVCIKRISWFTHAICIEVFPSLHYSTQKVRQSALVIPAFVPPSSWVLSKPVRRERGAGIGGSLTAALALQNSPASAVPSPSAWSCSVRHLMAAGARFLSTGLHLGGCEPLQPGSVLWWLWSASETCSTHTAFAATQRWPLPCCPHEVWVKAQLFGVFSAIKQQLRGIWNAAGSTHLSCPG